MFLLCACSESMRSCTTALLVVEAYYVRYDAIWSNEVMTMEYVIIMYMKLCISVPSHRGEIGEGDFGTGDGGGRRE